jgi:hypothetical protein
MAAPLLPDLLWELIESCCHRSLPDPKVDDLAYRTAAALPEFCLSSAVAFHGRCCHKNWVAAQA